MERVKYFPLTKGIDLKQNWHVRPSSKILFCLFFCLFLCCYKTRKSLLLNSYICFFKKMNSKTSVNRIVKIVSTNVFSLRHPFGHRKVHCVYKIYIHIVCLFADICSLQSREALRHERGASRVRVSSFLRHLPSKFKFFCLHPLQVQPFSSSRAGRDKRQWMVPQDTLWDQGWRGRATRGGHAGFAPSVS